MQREILAIDSSSLLFYFIFYFITARALAAASLYLSLAHTFACPFRFSAWRKLELESFSVLSSGFMSACFDLALIGALLKLCFIPSASSTLCVCCGSLCYMLLCCFQQSLHLGFPAISMRLRSKRCVGFSYFVILC